MIIADQDEIISFAKDWWRDNPQKGGFTIDWDEFCFHNTTEPRKILIIEYATGNKVIAKRGVSLVGYTQMDLGIVKYHFEVGAGKENFEWAE